MGIAIADAEGLGALSMRRIAAELGVSTMALYRYVGGKDALVLQMVDTAIGEFPLTEAPDGWRDGVAAVARLQWAAYRRHLWLASAISLGRPQLLPNLLPHTDAVLRALRGVDKSDALYAAITVFAYVRGVALAMETEAYAEQDTGLTADEWVDRQSDQMAALVATGNLTGFRELLADGFDFDYDLDRLFEFGLGLVLDGLEVRLAPATLSADGFSEEVAMEPVFAPDVPVGVRRLYERRPELFVPADAPRPKRETSWSVAPGEHVRHAAGLDRGLCRRMDPGADRHGRRRCRPRSPPGPRWRWPGSR